MLIVAAQYISCEHICFQVKTCAFWPQDLWKQRQPIRTQLEILPSVCHFYGWYSSEAVSCVKHKAWKRLTGPELLCLCVYCLYLHLRFGMCVSSYCAGVSLLSGRVCTGVQGWMVPVWECLCGAFLICQPQDWFIKTQRMRQPLLMPSFCFSRKHKVPKTPPPLPQSHFPLRQS